MNLPVYVVHPIDGEGHSHTLQRNYLLPISNNLEQEAGDNSAEGDAPSDEPTPVLHGNDALLVDHPTKSQPEGMLYSPPEQCEPFDPGSTGLTSADPTDEYLPLNHFGFNKCVSYFIIYTNSKINALVLF